MPDDFPYERRRSDREIGERLARVEANQEIASEEISKVRATVHEVVSKQTALTLMAEEAQRSHAELTGEIRNLSQKIDPTIASVAQSSLTLAMHVQQTTEFRAEQREKNKETDIRFGKIERTIYIATGGAAVVWAAASLLLDLLKH